MIEVKGKYEEALIMLPNEDYLESSAKDLIQNYVDQPYAERTNPVIMPDVHTGVDCVIGFTAKVNQGVRPGLVGVDIGCGVLAINIGKPELESFDTIDKKIREIIPLGFDTHDRNVTDRIDYIEVAERCECNVDRMQKSIGTLGGGNHFIELAESKKTKDIWLLVHSGSRNFGHGIATHHMNVAGKEFDDGVLRGDFLQQYLNDMVIANDYATTNRLNMVKAIASVMGWISVEHIESVHNYYNHTDNIIRKGAIRAGRRQPLLIPLNMCDGTLVGVGRGNAMWNYSAPHGAGRVMSRTKARKNLSMDTFKDSMEGVWSSCVTKNHLDEAPEAYKPSDVVTQALKDTVILTDHLIPIYNLKG